MAPLEEITYGLARRALDQQEAAVDEIRARTGTLLTAATITASFLGAQGIARHGLTTVILLALATFAACLFVSVYVLVPKDGLGFAIDATVVYEALFGEDEAAAYRELTYWLQDTRDANTAVVEMMSRAFAVAAGCVIAQVVLLAVGLTQ